MTPSEKEATQTYFAKLGFTAEMVDAYIALHTHGPQTISELARSSGIERTRIYRILPELEKNNLIETQVDYKRGILRPAPATNLQILIARKEQELQSLQDDLPLLEKTLASEHTAGSTNSRVQFYHAEDGVKQMFWNATKASTEVTSILYQNIQIKTNSKFFDRWVTKSNERNIHFRGIVSDTFLASQKQWYGDPFEHRLQYWEARYITPTTFPIQYGITTYDNVVAHFNWNNTEIFGTEIYNQQIADTQRQFFEMLWEKATPLPSRKG